MAKSLRIPEIWFKRGLWTIAIIFAWFLIRLGGISIHDLPKVEKILKVENFINPRIENLYQTQKTQENLKEQKENELEQAQITFKNVQGTTQALQKSYESWLTTRQATQDRNYDEELTKRNDALDEARKQERMALRNVQEQQRELAEIDKSLDNLDNQISVLRSEGQRKLQIAQSRQETKVFLLRLLVTLPFLILAGWLFVKHRKHQYWPFVWGFIIFALFVFFVELVPYLPSYGGYVRYTVGIIITVLVGRSSIIAMTKYLERQKEVEALPEEDRRQELRKELSYDSALVNLERGICPGCERTLNLQNDKLDFCPHCGINLFHKCISCGTRKSAFIRFCFSCGTATITSKEQVKFAN